ncbi:MAG: hypothetical protein K8S13_12150 [Desulfobacula sp.]|nr:hypothetical protein [Desulfobacula sp.]
MILKGMGFLGLDLDLTRNEGTGAQDCLLSSKASNVDVVLVHTNEELMIAREALALWQKGIPAGQTRAGGNK